MFFLYNLASHITYFLLRILAIFHPKIKLFVKGRNTTFKTLRDSIKEEDKVIWMHTASLGEYEQGLPILKEVRKKYPQHKILLTFFSPSGYEIKKDTAEADITVYLPGDTRGNVKEFLRIAHPSAVIFVKYEIWPNFLDALGKSQTPTLLVSAIFNRKQVFFKWYGKFMKESLENFTHIFVQDQNSRKLLGQIGIVPVSVSGDTRFDRVNEILERDNRLSFMEKFKDGQLCVVAGSTWPEDESIITGHINRSSGHEKYVIAPHKMNPKSLEKLSASIDKKTILYSELNSKNIGDHQVLILDTIGLLTKVYSYADIAYVGGGFATGLHNTLEPAVFGVPVIIGPQYDSFKEANELVELKGINVVRDQEEFSQTLESLLSKPEYRKEQGLINERYIHSNKGATTMIMDYFVELV
ncbi:glycosyltransferase N-terminal domain-containing protein [Zeaxanthinibacter sp. PT1]|uniref:3-deoxy-D-manno-octulosonic acid transferase n=1 Tax=Zeaxanthinibacter TaxID=561554 RepID=UPI00234B9275|nr:glycosyltransferase N-terminal domain-containing protein [Zeaxanthinibacter sp. PT1]MDC6350231.1 glycosyltransferase N-terminal domain-containing protein [Zeaxanthinibacter sp. PT1]